MSDQNPNDLDERNDEFSEFLLEYLRHCYAADPDLMAQLVKVRYPVSSRESLSNLHELEIPIRRDEGRHLIGSLGILNGFLKWIGETSMVAAVHNQAGVLQGFAIRRIPRADDEPSELSLGR